MFLTENKLATILPLILDEEYIHNKTVPNSGLLMRPDFRFEQRKLIIEFDGWQHYCNSKTQAFDQLKKLTYESMGYTIIKIPYFVQLSTDVINTLFPMIDSVHEYEQEYEHGFIDKRCALPGNFNSIGVHIFKNDLRRFGRIVENDIKNSLEIKIQELTKRYPKKYAEMAVLGNELTYLIK